MKVRDELERAAPAWLSFQSGSCTAAGAALLHHSPKIISNNNFLKNILTLD